MFKFRLFSTLLLLIQHFSCRRFVSGSGETLSKLDQNKYSFTNEKRYILYDVNHGEGFNLRRDVYMRVANLVRSLREKDHQNFVLVLPPWGAIYHWQTRSIDPQIKLPWSLFFDLPSLNRFVPVLEFEDFLKETKRSIIDDIYYLQSYKEGWTHWEEKWHYRPCMDHNLYYKDENDISNDKDLWRGWFFGFDEVRAVRFHCISIQGHASMLKQIVLAENNTAKSIMFDRAETVLHDSFGDVNYWKARRSMRYNKKLVEIADQFRKSELNSDDISDNTTIDDDWTKEKVIPGRALGGPFLCVHWRRKDFASAHYKEVPSINGTAREIDRLLKKLDLNLVFLATDAPNEEVDQLKSYLDDKIVLKQYQPDRVVLETFKDGGVSIIDQWICAHARYFTGSHVSTFSFRIQDDREILGFPSNSTFNRMCPDENLDCEQNSRWALVQ